jgi:hypothetical protein
MFNIIYRNKFLRALIAFSRAFYYIKLKRKVNSFEADPEFVSKLTIFSNRRRVIKNNSVHAHPTARYLFGIDLDFLGEKSSLFINYLNSITFFYKARRDQHLLVIGPRNEAELFNFIGKGFNKNNISAIDLFSYSPMIETMDMHDLKFSKKKFDIVYAGWVIIYSENRRRAIEQMLSVTKPGGLIALTATLSRLTAEELENKRGYVVGSHDRFHEITDLTKLFDQFRPVCRIIYQTPSTIEQHSLGMVVVQKIA